MSLKVLIVGMVVVDRAGLVNDVSVPGSVQYTTGDIEPRIGGHPSAVAINLVKLGFPGRQVGVVAAIGNDSDGKFIEAELRRYSISRRFLKTNRSTGQNLIIIPKGQDRTFHISPGANLDLTADHVKDVLDSTQPNVLSIRLGYSGIDNSMSDILEAVSRDTFILVDVMKSQETEWVRIESDECLCGYCEHPSDTCVTYEERLRPNDIIEALAYASAVHCNEGEALYITKTSSLEDAVKVFYDLGIALIFITRGEGGAQLYGHNRFFHEERAFRVEARDMTGCGDSFCAGIIKKLLDWDATRNPRALSAHKLRELLRYGQAVGAACATGVGLTEGVTAENVDRILESTSTGRSVT